MMWALNLGRNQGWVSVGVDHDTAEFAVSSIRNWWRHMGYCDGMLERVYSLGG